MTESREVYDELAKTKPNITHLCSTKSTQKSDVVNMENFGPKTLLFRTLAWVLHFIAILEHQIHKKTLKKHFL